MKYNLNRTFDAATGRYLQSDSLGLAGGVSTYAYVSRSPLTWADVLGLDQTFGYRTIKGGSKSGIWQIQWKLSEPSQNPNYVVQTVTGVTPDGQTVVYSEAWEVGTGDVNTMVSQTRQVDDTFVGWKSLHAEATYYDGLELADSYTYGGGKYAHGLLGKPGGADIIGCHGSNTVKREFTPLASLKP